jgi:membrane fusion protein, multidrug efflux system
MTTLTASSGQPRENRPRASRARRQAAFVLLSGICLIALAGCGKGGYGGQPKGPAGAGGFGGPVPVAAAKATLETIPVTRNTFGNVQAYATVLVKSQVNGILSEVHFTDGQYVKAGDLLIVIDPRFFKAAVVQAEANLKRDQAQLELARAELTRTEHLLKTGVMAQDDYDKAKATADTADATVAADQAVIDGFKLQLGYCYITSPIEGRTGALLINEGNAIKANDVPIMTVNQIKPIYVSFSLPESDLAAVRRHMAEGPLELDAAIPGESAPPERGTIDFLDNSVTNTTGTITVRGVFANTDERLWPGQYVNVTLYLTTIPDAVVVPSPAVQAGQAGKYVFVVKPDMTVESRVVAAGEEWAGKTVITQGVAAGETVVTDGQLRLTPGAKVVLKPPVTGAPGAPRMESTASSLSVGSTSETPAPAIGNTPQ